MDNNNTHIYQSSYTSINTNQLAMLENLLQVQMSEIEKAIQQQLAIEKASWAQENKAQEAALENQVKKLQQQLANAQIHLGLQQRYTYVLSLLIMISDFEYSTQYRSLHAMSHYSTRSMSETIRGYFSSCIQEGLA